MSESLNIFHAGRKKFALGLLKKTPRPSFLRESVFRFETGFGWLGSVRLDWLISYSVSYVETKQIPSCLI